jgi:hypothetical protein
MPKVPAEYGATLALSDNMSEIATPGGSLASMAAAVLTAPYTAHPERLPAGLPHPPANLVKTWINPPEDPGALRRHHRIASHLPTRAPSPSLSSIAVRS